MDERHTEPPTRDPERTVRGEGADSVAVDYRRSACATATTVAHNFVVHMRQHQLAVVFRCSLCGRTFPTVYGAAVHHARCRRGPQTTTDDGASTSEQREPVNTCTECSRAFTTFTGLQLHRKSAHPDEFEATRPREGKPRWQRFEIEALASLEAGLSGTSNVKAINLLLKNLLYRRYGLTGNVDMIKGAGPAVEVTALALSVISESVPEGSDDDGLRVPSPQPMSTEASCAQEALRAFLAEFTAAESGIGVEYSLRRLAERALTGETVLDETASVVLAVFPAHQPSVHVKRAWSAENSKESTRRMKQRRFEELRRLYNNDKKRLAEVVLDHPAQGHSVSLTDCLEFYRSIFASPSPPDDANVLPKTNAAAFSLVDVLLSPITEEEITTALKKIAPDLLQAQTAYHLTWSSLYRSKRSKLYSIYGCFTETFRLVLRSAGLFYSPSGFRLTDRKI
ncbi:hypothetical protein M514_23762 [Trichuris suis]|uniref:C2H2-type domain-containing protein n=1 Tax=Trichuris suis TaxID=68888 RepID=A0A085N3K6_9BILA|nr:hypothetical protein M514_23762 [Trichuris suis]